MEGPASSTHAILITGVQRMPWCQADQPRRPRRWGSIWGFFQLVGFNLARWNFALRGKGKKFGDFRRSRLPPTVLKSKQSEVLQNKIFMETTVKTVDFFIKAPTVFIKLMGDSVEELRQSLAVMGHLGGQKLRMQISDMQTWVSAAMTDDQTCVEGLQQGAAGGAAGNTGVGEVKSMVRGQVLNVAQMTSNALALINGLVSVRSSSP